MQPPFFCDCGANIQLGERVFFNNNRVVADVCAVWIGSSRCFGSAGQIYTPMHPFNAEMRRREELGKEVEIGAMSGSAVAPSSCAEGGSDRARRSKRQRRHAHVAEGVLAAGNPCRVIRDFDRRAQRRNGQ